MKNLTLSKSDIIEIFKLWNDNFKNHPENFEPDGKPDAEVSADYFIELSDKIKSDRQKHSSDYHQYAK